MIVKPVSVRLFTVALCRARNPRKKKAVRPDTDQSPGRPLISSTGPYTQKGTSVHNNWKGILANGSPTR